MLERIQNALNNFSDGNLTENALSFFATLGYESNRQIPLDEKSFEGFQNEFITDESNFSRKNAFVEDWQYADLLFQLTGDELGDQSPLFSDNSLDQRITSYLFFVIGLSEENYSRTKLSQITREVNKVFQIPVMILFKYGELVTLAVIDRQPHKRDESKDVLRKVTLIKDIRFKNPHAAHRLILRDLSLPELQDEFTLNSFLDLHNAWQKVLDTKELNKRFFKELANWYFWAVENVEFPADEEKNAEVRNATSVIRLITRLIFVWFLKEKGLVSDKIFDESYLKTILKFDDESAYYKAILQNLFFATLNSEMNTRKFIGESSGGRNTQHFVHNVFRYRKEFIQPDETVTELFEPIPFLNGGLFECLDKETEVDGTKCRVRVDGFSDHPKNVLSIPDKLFFGAEHQIDLNEIFGTKNKRYKVRGLINLLNSYKFTIAENTPLEEEIALDPELLGKVFENLLASYNPETKTTARKQTGSFYTPREIVNYMVDESLIAYLKAKLQTEISGFQPIANPQGTLGGNDWRDGQLELEYPLNQNRWQSKDEDLEMALRDLFSYSQDESRFNEIETEILIKAIDDCKILDPACGSGAFPMGILQRLVFLLKKLDPNNEKWREWQRQTAIKETEKAFNEGNKQEREDRLLEISDVFENNASDYGRKLFLIENCIYGVDIQPIAIQIAKLRFFISLIVDEKTDKEKENLGIRPLPNLETKFVAANTLIGLEAQGGLKPTKVNDLEKDLKEVRAKHFSARTRKTKEKYRAKDKEIRLEIADLLKQGGIKADIADQIANWNPYDQNASATWFDAEYMFGIEKGFDIVIGNPPYVRPHKLSKDFKQILWQNYKSFVGKSDLYCCFIENSIDSLRRNGFLSFITSNSFLRLDSFEALRKILLEGSLNKIIDFEGNVFESAAVKTSVLVYTKIKPTKEHTVDVLSTSPDTNLASISFKKIPQLEFSKTYKSIFDLSKDSKLDSVKSTIRQNTFALGEKFQISFGLKTGDDTKFLSSIAKTSQHKKLLRGENIQRYSVNFSGEYVWYVPAKMRQHRQTARPGTASRFEQPKVLVRDTGDGLICTFDKDNFYVKDVLIVSDVQQNSNLLKSLTGILNSTMMKVYYETSFPTLHVQRDELASLPIKILNNKQQTEIAEIVDEIIEAKKRDSTADTKELERKIDCLVYQLYGLTDEEIRIVEGKE